MTDYTDRQNRNADRLSLAIWGVTLVMCFYLASW